MKRLFAAVLLACLMLGLCACNGDKVPATDNSTQGTTLGTTQAPTETATAAFDGYTVKVVDTEGKPLAGAVVQLCLGTNNCNPQMTGLDGAAKYDLPEEDYKVSFVVLPSGYDYADETKEFHFADGSKELTITLKAIAG